MSNANLNASAGNPVLKVSLTDAPNKDLKAVVVNIAQIEPFVQKNNNYRRSLDVFLKPV